MLTFDNSVPIYFPVASKDFFLDERMKFNLSIAVFNFATTGQTRRQTGCLAWLEDMAPWVYTDQYKTMSDALETPVLTGEDIYLLSGFRPLIDARAVDIVHPDLATSGGIAVNKKNW